MPNSDLPPAGSACCHMPSCRLPGRDRRVHNRVLRPYFGHWQRRRPGPGDGKNPKRSPLQRCVHEPSQGSRLCCHANCLPLAHRLPDSLPKLSPRQLCLKSSGRTQKDRPARATARATQSPPSKYIFAHAIKQISVFHPPCLQTKAGNCQNLPLQTSRPYVSCSGVLQVWEPRDDTCLHVQPC